MTTPLSARLDEKLMKRLDKICDREGYTRAEAVRESIRRFIREMEDE